MRKFDFKARNIGTERYLTYIMDESCELDEDILDYCDENQIKELVDIIYEEGEEDDFLTYNVTGKVSIEMLMKDYVNCEAALNIVRNISKGLINLKEQAINLSYILLNRGFIYVDKETLAVQFICVPVESEGSVATEFKGFVRQLLANFKYDVDEDVSYVAKLLTYINGDGFNLRGIIGLVEALMEDEGLEFADESSIDVDGQEVEVVSASQEDAEEVHNVSDFMSTLGEADELPEIGDEDEDDEDNDDVEEDGEEELDSILPVGLKLQESNEVPVIPVVPMEEVEESEESVDDEAVEKSEDLGEENAEELEDALNEASLTEEDIEEPQEEKKATIEEIERKIAPPEELDVIKNRIKQLVGEVPMARTKQDAHGNAIKTLQELDEMLESRPPVIKKQTVKVNRAALIQNAVEHETEHEVEGNTSKLVREEEPQVKSKPAKSKPAKSLKSEESSEKAQDSEESEVKEEAPKSGSILSKSILSTTKAATASLLGGNSSDAIKAMPYLIRVNTEERIMLNKVTFKIGKAARGVDYSVTGNGAISRQHAVIAQRDGVSYIRDNKSTNHTYINGKKIEDGEEEILTHESKIRLGDEEFVFKIR